VNFKDSIQYRYRRKEWFVICKEGLFSVKDDSKQRAEDKAKVEWQKHVDAGDYDKVETVSIKAAEPVSLAASINKALHPSSNGV
jgi:hypothetical protein